jgi:hypothetical protein
LNAVFRVNRTQGKDESNFEIWTTVYPKIVDCARMASSSVRKRRSSTDGFTVRAILASSVRLRAE